MNGWQRFGMLIVCCFLVMVLYPNFEGDAWNFILMVGGLWTGLIMVISVISNLFGLYRFETLNKLITIVLLGGIIYSLLWYFPQTDKVSPINKLKHGEFPTKEDLDKGLKRFTFNFDFVRRNVNRDENFINQDMNKEKVKKEIKKQVSKKTDQMIDELDIHVE
jgi:hypothetical protein